MVFRRAFLKYNACLEKSPLLTKCVTSGLLGVSGDLVAQGVSDEPFDQRRFASFVALQTLLVAPVLHKWYGHVFKLFPGTSYLSLAKRVGADQFVFAPVFVASFISSNLVLMGKSDLIVTKLKEDWFHTVRANNAVWIPAMIINFGFVPAQYHVLFSNVVGLFWNCYLSFMTFRNTATSASALVDSSDVAEDSEIKRE
mmetsp:Transcript_7581/g.12755  ORF Transcript_7581/g.12755 Transcript_7581/m.12755 type:complete len:198 (-) Transcript_7581:832-1425(-)